MGHSSKYNPCPTFSETLNYTAVTALHRMFEICISSVLVLQETLSESITVVENGTVCLLTEQGL
jgi:hypothetical protein